MPESSPDVGNYNTNQLLFSWFPRFVLSIFILCVISVAVLFIINHLNTAPTSFPSNTSFVVEDGMSAKAVAAALRGQGFIRSEIMFYLTLVLQHDPTKIKAAEYRFAEPLSTPQLATELTTGHFAHSLVRLTFIEGERATHIASRAALLLDDFDTEAFLAQAIPAEGRLFPDTYFVPSDFSATDLYMLLTNTFSIRTEPLQAEIANHPLTEDEIITLASILEREANTPESMAMVSGILQNRLAIGMPLQADASIEYILNKPLGELLPEDLKIDSPYNTYLTNELPPTPIGNPGLTAITAVLRPAVSNYYYYITDETGKFHYAETFDQHRINIARYLR